MSESLKVEHLKNNYLTRKVWRRERVNERERGISTVDMKMKKVTFFYIMQPLTQYLFKIKLKLFKRHGLNTKKKKSEPSFNMSKCE